MRPIPDIASESRTMRKLRLERSAVWFRIRRSCHMNRQGFIAATNMKLEGLSGSTIVSRHTSGTLHQVIAPLLRVYTNED
jgi:hypothetical protein